MKNATVRVLADGQTHWQTDRLTDWQTDRLTDWQTQTDFIICPMLYAVAVEQVKVLKKILSRARMQKCKYCKLQQAPGMNADGWIGMKITWILNSRVPDVRNKTRTILELRCSCSRTLRSSPSRGGLCRLTVTMFSFNTMHWIYLRK